ncbi:MAG: anti-sigma regulatory factor [Thermoflexales bacterium]|nr:anti-sigma regulatory factor [Thermoflexales bacterium]
MADVKRIPIQNDLDIVRARVEGRNMARALGFGIIDQARIATAISELARNIVLYAKIGEVIVRQVENVHQCGIEIVCSDSGPGIADITLVMRDGYSSHQGLGMGLPGTKRLMDEFEIMSEAGIGTTVTVRKWLK